MLVTLYSREPLPLEIRTTFDLQAWPYNPEHSHLFYDYMKKLTIFRYEDDQFTDGGKDIGHPLNIDKPSGPFPFQAYYSYCALSNSTLTIMNWPADNPEGYAMLKKLDEHPIGKDRKAWFYWNAPVTINDWSDLLISREIDYSNLEEHCEDRGCRKHEVGKVQVEHLKD